MSILTTGILIKSFFVVLSALIGSISVFSFKMNHLRLCSLISFSAGALFGAAAFSIVPETFESLGYIELIIGIVSGYFVFWLISKYYFHVCPACSAHHFDEQTTKRFSEIVKLMVTALSFHSLFDGIAITGGSDHNHFGNNSVFIAILVHKFPEGLALASLMLGAGYEKSKIILYVVLVELTTVLGAVIGIFLIDFHISEMIIGFLMAHIAGGFVYLAFHAIIGEMLEHHTKLVITFFSLGALVILITTLLTHTLL